MKTEQLKNYFNQITIIPQEEWDDFAQKLSIVTKASGELLLHEGQVCNFVSFINKGLVRVYEIVDGVEVNRTFFMQGFFATEYQSFISRQPSKEYLEVVLDVELVMIDHQHLQNMYDKYKSFERLGRLLSESLYIKLRKKIERFQIKSPEERYLQLLHENPDIREVVHIHNGGAISVYNSIFVGFPVGFSLEGKVSHTQWQKENIRFGNNLLFRCETPIQTDMDNMHKAIKARFDKSNQSISDEKVDYVIRKTRQPRYPDFVTHPALPEKPAFNF